jgi:hypothetical protein
VRAALVKWLVACKPVWSKGARRVLRAGYAVWFAFVDHACKSHVCRLLYALTRRQDVTPWRGRVLGKVLLRDTSAPVLALAELFARYQPNCVQFPARFVRAPARG